MDFDLLVIGGGISGMSLAHHAARAGRRVLVLEKRATLGGCIQTHRLADGFWFELGAHTCYNSYATLISLLERKPGLEALLPRRKLPFRVHAGGEVRPITRELKLGELLLSAPRILFAKKKDATVRNYYSRIVGRRNYDHLFSPIFAAVPSQPADDFPAEILFKRRTRRKDVLRSFSLRGGLQSIIEALQAEPGLEVRTSVEVTSVSRREGGYEIRLGNRDVVSGSRLALALPPSAGARLMQDSHPAVASALSRLVVTAIESLGVVVKRDATHLEPLTALIPLDGRFHSAVSRDVVEDPGAYRGFTFHFRAGTPLEQKRAIAGEVLGVDPNRFEQVEERRYELPSPRLGHAEIVAEIDRALQGTSLLATGNYFGGLAIEDCLLRSRSEAQRLG